MDETVRNSAALRAKYFGIVDAITEDVHKTAVAVVRGNRPIVEQIGSGNLFTVADRKFVVTAGHVVLKARRMEASLRVSGAKENFVATPGRWFHSSDGPDTEYSSADLAIYPLNGEQVAGLQGKQFLRLSDVDFSKETPNAFFFLWGFPQVMCDLSASDEVRVGLGPMKLGTSIATP